MGHLQAADLFRHVDHTQQNRSVLYDHSVLVAEVDTDLLSGEVKQLSLTLPDGFNQTVHFKQRNNRAIGGYSWFGIEPENPSNHLHINVYEDAIAGSLHTDEGVFEIQPLGKYRIRLVRLNSDSFPECAGGEPVPQPMVGGQLPLNNISNNRATNTVDVIVVYTPEARVGAGGHNGIKATAQAAVDAMNNALVNSQVDTEIVLLYAGEVNYNDSNSSSTDLNWLQSSSEVENLKNQYGADMTALLVQSMSGSCGRGYVMRNPGPGFRDYAVQVTRVSCAVGNLSFAHEFGHNMGLEHDPVNGASPANASYPWSFGHYHSGQYRTVMSYSSECSGSCTRRQYFSNPDVNYLGLPSGIDNERDNARTLDLTSPVSAAFRVRTPDVIFANGFD